MHGAEEIPRQEEYCFLAFRVMQEAQKELTPLTCKREFLHVPPKRIEGGEAFRRAQVPPRGVLRKIHPHVLEGLHCSTPPALCFSHPLTEDWQASATIREEDAETIGIARIIGLEDKRFSGDRTSQRLEEENCAANKRGCNEEREEGEETCVEKEGCAHDALKEEREEKESSKNSHDSEELRCFPEGSLSLSESLPPLYLCEKRGVEHGGRQRSEESMEKSVHLCRGAHSELGSIRKNIARNRGFEKREVLRVLLLEESFRTLFGDKAHMPHLG